MAVEESKAKYIRALLDRALGTKVPQMSPEEFERMFGFKATRDQIADYTFAELMVMQLVTKAASGNERSIQEVMDRLLGKPVQQTEAKSVSYTYHDFLVRCKEMDAEDGGKVVDIPPPPAPLPTKPVTRKTSKPRIIPEVQSEDDILRDLM